MLCIKIFKIAENLDNMKDYNELKTILPGLQEDMPRPFYMIGELLDYGSFELCIQEKDGRKEYIIPYIMNDAVECYLSMKDASWRGDYQPEREVTEVELLVPQEDGRYGLIVHQGYDNVVTLWFETLVMHAACYRYHEIGHFWVKGQEQWRQLVYMVGTMADKYRWKLIVKYRPGNAFCEMMGEALKEFAKNKEFVKIEVTADPYDIN